jgi:hypothetical protein
MAKPFPTDEFDAVTGPGGRHRAKPGFASRLISFLRYSLVTVLLAVAGIAGLTIVSGENKFNDVLNLGNQTTTVAQPQFKADGLGVTVVDGTNKSGLASTVAHKLFDAGWNVLTASNYSLLPKLKAKVPTPAPLVTSATGEVIGAQTIIYVNSATAKNAATKLMQTLGSYKVIESNNYGDPITVILGSDYK